MISDLKKRTMLTDPKWNRIPKESKILIYQIDSTFNESINELIYTYNSGSFGLSLENVLPLKVGIFKIIGPRNLKMNITIVQTDKFYLFHGICEVDVINAFGLAKRYEKNLYNRIKALFKWFKHNISEN